MSMFDEVMLILALRTCFPCSKSPFFILEKISRLSSTGLFLNGLSFPGSVGVPFWAAISLEVCESIYALSFFISSTAQSCRVSK